MTAESLQLGTVKAPPEMQVFGRFVAFFFSLKILFRTRFCQQTPPPASQRQMEMTSEQPGRPSRGADICGGHGHVYYSTWRFLHVPSGRGEALPALLFRYSFCHSCLLLTQQQPGGDTFVQGGEVLGPLDKGRTGSSVAQGGVELQGSRGRVHADPTWARQPRASGDRQSDKQETTSGPPPQTSRLPAATVCSFCELLRVRQSPRGGASAASETCQPVTHCRARGWGSVGTVAPSPVAGSTVCL